MATCKNILLLLLIIAQIQFVHFAALAQEPVFGSRIDLGLLEYARIDEASGMAASRINENVLYTHNDSGDRNVIYALNTRGEHLGEYIIKGWNNRDCEAMAVGPGPVEGVSYLYVGDFGDNDAVYNLKYIYRFPEPEVDAGQKPVRSTIYGAEILTFQYPDGNRDAETLIVDPLTRDIYIISKREENVRVYCFPFPQSTTETSILKRVGTLPFYKVVAGDISPSGEEILIKVYKAVYLYHRSAGQSIAEALAGSGVALPYIPEPQGEAICWKPDGTGYFTLSEEKKDIPAHLYFYPRLDADVRIKSQSVESDSVKD